MITPFNSFEVLLNVLQMNENVLRIYIILYRFLFEEGLCHISVYSFHQWVKDIARKYRF